MPVDKVKYVLKYDGLDYKIGEPRGWQSSTFIYSRDNKYHGIDLTLSDSLEYFGFACNMIKKAYNKEGINADVVITRYKKGDGELWNKEYSSSLDFTTLLIKSNSITIKFNSSKYLNIFKSNKSTAIEYGTTNSLLGNIIPETFPKDLYIKGRLIEEKSFLKMTQQLPMGNKEWSGQNMLIGKFLPLSLLKYGTPDDENISDTSNEDVLWGEYNNNTGMERCFYKDADKDKQLHIELSLDIMVSVDTIGVSDPLSFGIRLGKYNVDGNYIQNSHIIIKSYDIKNTGTRDLHIKLDYNNDNYQVSKNESIALEYYVSGKLGTNNSSANVEIGFFTNRSDYQKADLKVTGISAYKPTESKYDKLYDLFKHGCMAQMEFNFDSNFLSASTFKDLGLLHGYWLRGFQGDEETFKPMKFSVDDLLNNLNTIVPVGMYLVEDTLFVEDLNFFYPSFVVGEICDITDLEISIDSKINTSIEIGYAKSEIDEPDGSLFEFNSSTIFSTGMHATKKDLKLVSKYRADGDGIEKARRSQQDFESSTGYDSEIWFVDTVFDQAITTQIIAPYSTHFLSPPLFVYDADNVINLRLSPANNIHRQGKVINPMYHNIKDAKLIYASSKGNSNMESFPFSGKTIIENSDIEVQDINKGYYSGRLAKFTHDEMIDGIKGTTNGIPNKYGLIVFSDSDTKLMGYIHTIKKNGNIYEYVLKIK